ncbi:MAG: DUF3237 domain-containing protein [Lachnospiraceae bacterium]|nr:DUF3237 domain-containing protein [Lachnospiraceae bacterium]
MQEVLRIDVLLDQVVTVQGADGEVTMILFHGTFSCELGAGRVLPGGVDTQIQRQGENKSLSARYILEGKDEKQKPFRIFVENNGICTKGETLKTCPVIYTDAEELQWMEREKLSGIVEASGENKVQIRIYRG